MIPVLLVALLQVGGTYTHLPKLTLFPKPAAAPAIASLMKLDAPAGRCSVHMPRMAVPKDVEFHIRTVKPDITDTPIAVVPAPECAAPKSK